MRVLTIEEVNEVSGGAVCLGLCVAAFFAVGAALGGLAVHAALS